MLVYLIKNNINNKFYIGQTTRSLGERFRKHISAFKDGKNNCSKLYNAFSKYGVENFSIKPLAVCSTLGELNFLEEALISKFNTIKDGYNIKQGGLNHTHSQETKNKIGLKHKGKKISEKQKQHLREIKTGKKGSISRSKKISKIQTGRKLSPEHVENARLGVLKSREKKINNKLKIDDVKQIKNLIKQDYSDSVIAQMFNVSRRNINFIRRGVNWKDIE